MYLDVLSQLFEGVLVPCEQRRHLSVHFVLRVIQHLRRGLWARHAGVLVQRTAVAQTGHGIVHGAVHGGLHGAARGATGGR